MENLPLEVVEEICRHLTVWDLISCCGVSRDWRAMFNQDSLWKPHCRQDLEKYLRITPSTVEPGFVRPDPESSSLSPVCKWRLAYMRQNHLWNNWRTGNSNSQVLEYHDADSGVEVFEWNFRVEFVKENYLAKIYDERIEIWDLREDPVIKVVDTFHYFPRIETFLCVPSGSDMIVFNHETGVQVFKLEYESKSIGLKHAFDFNHSHKLPENTPELVTKLFQEKYPPRLVFVATVGNLFVGVGNCMLHVWDLESGNKKREEVSPKEGTIILSVTSSVNSEDLLVKCRILSTTLKLTKQQLMDSHFYCIYSSKRLAFYPFIKSNVTVRTVGELGKNCLLCYNGQDGHRLTIYNYKRSEMVFNISLEVCLIDELNFGFLLMDLKNVWYTFDTTSFVWKSFKLEELRHYQRLCGNFLRMQFDKPDFPTQIWEIGSRTKKTKVSLGKVTDTINSNKICTRVVIEEDNEHLEQFILTVKNFW